MDLQLSGRRAVVTGASKGIGLAITRTLAAEGVFVIAGARSSSPELQALAEAGLVLPVVVDLADPDGPSTLVAHAEGRLDIVVNNVGLATSRTDGFLSVTDEQWSASLTLNLLAAVRTCRAALPIMLAAGRGVIVNTGSVNAVLPDPAVVDYSAAKAALANLAKSLSKEFGPRGIRVNTVNPGPVETDLWLGPDGVAQTRAKATGLTPEEIQQGAVAGTATRRFTRPSEVADLVAFLASDVSGNVTGTEVLIDGGLVPTM
jgi:NAD(P)-dependent dehydrogenase (short-subunit alcohol dehydrogenase family)